MTSDVVEWLTGRGGFTAGTFRAERFVLFSSKSSRGGGPYLVEEAYEVLDAMDSGVPSQLREELETYRGFPFSAVAEPSCAGPSGLRAPAPISRLWRRRSSGWVPTRCGYYGAAEPRFRFEVSHESG